MKGRILGVLALLTVLHPAAAFAASGPGMAPSAGWNEMQKFEYRIGQLGSALNICGNLALSRQMRELADLSPYGRRGWQSMLSFDGIRGGYCGRIAADAEKVLADGGQLKAYLSGKYRCSGRNCGPAGSDDSLDAPCRAEAEDRLASLPLARNQVRSIYMYNRNVGDTLQGIGTDGHEAWVRLNTCSGWLIIELSKGCYPRRAFTRGDCAVDGVSRY